MSFLWPWMLLSLLALPALIWLYGRAQARRRQLLARYAGSRPTAGTWQRHVPPALLMVGLAILAVALARPQMTLSLPRAQGTIILAFDVSGSMAADDIPPNRLEAAKAAAREFASSQPPTVRIGMVAFSESGLAIQSPTADRQALLAAVNRLTPARGTSLASGILAALAMIDDLDKQEPTNYYSNRPPQPSPTPTPMPAGVYQPAVVVLISDGENTTDPDPLLAAEAAAYRGVRIHTIGVGSPEGARLNIDGFIVQTRLDEAMLQYIAQRTGGTYYNAQRADDLRAIYESVGFTLLTTPEATEVTALLAGLGMIVMLVGGGWSLIRSSRLP